MESLFGLPGMLFWGVACAIPILIHLFARQRYKRVPWAAMEFLLRAFKKTRKRIRLEQILLLLLRILAILLFVLALANPRLNPSILAGGPDARREVIAVLDTSFSMALTEPDGGTPMARLKEQMRLLLGSIQQERGDSVTLITSGKPAQLLLKEVTNKDQVLGAVEELETGDGATDLVGALRTTVAVLEDMEAGAEVYLFSDLQKVAFIPPGEGPAGDEHPTGDPEEGRAQQLLSSLVQEIRARKAVLNIVAPADAPTDNIALVALEKRSKVVVKGTTATFAATLRNFGTRPQGGVVRFFVDGAAEPVDFRDVDIVAPGGLHTVNFRYTFRAEGSHFVEARFLSDNLEVDNRRSLALEVRNRLKTLIVDGNPAPDPGDSESFFYAAALSPGGDRAAENEFDIEVIQEIAFEQRDLTDVDLLVLIDVALISSRRAETVTRFVARGGGLIVFVGPKTRTAESLNQHLWKGGSGILPGKIGRATGGGPLADLFFLVTRPDLTHPALAYFDDPALRPWISALAVYRFHEIEVDPEAEDVRVLAWLDQPKASLPKPTPFIAEKRKGSGKVLLVATSAGDPDWNEMFAFPTYLLLQRELAYYVTRREERLENLTVGHTYERTLKSFSREVVISHDGRQESVVRPVAVENGDGYELKTGALDRAGIYRFDMRIEGEPDIKDPNPLHVAVNVDPVESDLTRVDGDFVLASFPGDGVRFLDGVKEVDDESTATRDGRAWWWLLLLGAAILAVETALSQIFGMRARGNA